MRNGVRHLSIVLFLFAFFAGCNNEQDNFPRSECLLCGSYYVPNVVFGYEDLRENPTNTLDTDIQVELGEMRRVIDLNNEDYGYDEFCPVFFPKRLNCLYAFRGGASDEPMTVRVEIDGELHEQKYSTYGFGGPCPSGTGYIKLTRDDTGYHLAKEAVLVTECEENP